jgi:hypothetical protein
MPARSPAPPRHVWVRSEAGIIRMPVPVRAHTECLPGAKHLPSPFKCCGRRKWTEPLRRRGSVHLSLSAHAPLANKPPLRTRRSPLSACRLPTAIPKCFTYCRQRIHLMCSIAHGGGLSTQRPGSAKHRRVRQHARARVPGGVRADRQSRCNLELTRDGLALPDLTPRGSTDRPRGAFSRSQDVQDGQNGVLTLSCLSRLTSPPSFRASLVQCFRDLSLPAFVLPLLPCFRDRIRPRFRDRLRFVI